MGLTLLGSPGRRGGGRRGPRPSPLAGVQGPLWTGGLSRPGPGLTGLIALTGAEPCPGEVKVGRTRRRRESLGALRPPRCELVREEAAGGSGRQSPLPTLREEREERKVVFHARLHQTGRTSLASQRALQSGSTFEAVLGLSPARCSLLAHR